MKLSSIFLQRALSSHLRQVFLFPPITLGNIANCCMGISYNVWGFPVTTKDRLISYLPAAHVYEFAIECYFTMIGASIGFYQVGDWVLLSQVVSPPPVWAWLTIVGAGAMIVQSVWSAICHCHMSMSLQWNAIWCTFRVVWVFIR